MNAAPALLDLQRRFLAALYDGDRAAGAAAAVLGRGLDPAARLRIYRHASAAIQTGALRATYPALRALVGEAFFEQTARGYRKAHPSRGGNLQAFGAHFATYLRTLPAGRPLAWLPDVARLEWRRQQAALAAEPTPCRPKRAEAAAGAAHGQTPRVHPSVRLLASRHPVLTIWRYAMQPTSERLRLGNGGERIVLWRETGQVAMAALDAASFACIRALARGAAEATAGARARAIDAAFDLVGCLASFRTRGLLLRAPFPSTPRWLPSP